MGTAQGINDGENCLTKHFYNVKLDDSRGTMIVNNTWIRGKPSDYKYMASLTNSYTTTGLRHYSWEETGHCNGFTIVSPTRIEDLGPT